MASDDVPPFLRRDASSVSMLSRQIVVFERTLGGETWWQWDVLDLSGLGVVDVRYSRPHGECVPPSEAPKFEGRMGTATRPPLFFLEAPLVEP